MWFIANKLLYQLGFANSAFAPQNKELRLVLPILTFEKRQLFFTIDEFHTPP